MTPNSLYWLDIDFDTYFCPLVIKSSMFACFPQLKFLKVHGMDYDASVGPNHACKFQLDEPLHALETMIVWQALTFPAGTKQAAAGFLPNVQHLCAQLSTDDAQTMLDLGVAASLLFARFFLMNEQGALPGGNDEDYPSYDELVVLGSNQLQYLQLQGPENRDLSLVVHKVSIHLESHACRVALYGDGGRWSDDVQKGYDLSGPSFRLRARHLGV